jgi:hypothetical protein
MKYFWFHVACFLWRSFNLIFLGFLGSKIKLQVWFLVFLLAIICNYRSKQKMQVHFQYQCCESFLMIHKILDLNKFYPFYFSHQNLGYFETFISQSKNSSWKSLKCFLFTFPTVFRVFFYFNLFSTYFLYLGLRYGPKVKGHNIFSH